MAAILLGWNPEQWNDWDPDYDSAVNEVAERGHLSDNWSVGRHRNIENGTDAWLLLQGRQRGVIGHGMVTSVPYEDVHYADPNKRLMYVDLVFDVLLPIGEQIPPEELSVRIPGVKWGSVYQSGTRVPTEEEASLRALWAEHVGSAPADPTSPVPGTYPEGALTRVLANKYERSPQARRECIAHNGTICAACGFSFKRIYGDLGKGFIHIHHVVPVSELGTDYELDPKTDLVPLCANCHAMAHRGNVSHPLTPAQLRQLIVETKQFEG